MSSRWMKNPIKVFHLNAASTGLNEFALKDTNIEYDVAYTAPPEKVGLMPGDQLRSTKRAPFQGPLLVEANGRLIALGRGVAAKVEVRLCE